jgi:uncharacterized protein
MQRPSHLTRMLCAAEPQGCVAAVESLLGAAEEADVQAVALVGDLSGWSERDRAAQYRALFRTLGGAGIDTYWVPGPSDAPVGDYLREAHNSEVAYPFLHGVHGMAAFAAGTTLVAGFGGYVDDDPGAGRDEESRLRYARWEVEYRLKMLGRELSEHEQPILLFATPVAHKGAGVPGSEALAELALTYRARLVVCGGERRSMLLGRTLVVAPGPLSEGCYAIADLRSRTAALSALSVPAG